MKKTILSIFFVNLILISSIVFADVKPSIDMDNDGLPDTWEFQYTQKDLSILDKDSDYDGDGISNGVEYQIGTDPTTPNPNGPRISYTYDKLGRIVKIERIPSQ